MPDFGYWSGSLLALFMKTKFSLWGIAVSLSLMLPALTACGDNDDGPDGNSADKGTKSGEWYTSGFATSSDFRDINQAIDNHELLASYSRPTKKEYYAEPDFFFDDYGFFSTYGANFGRLRFKPEQQIANVLHILKDNTAEAYTFVVLYRANDVPGPKFRTINAGNLGKLCYSTSDSPTIYTYVEYDGKYVFSNGDIYVKRGDSLVQSGSSDSLTRFTPESL